MADDYTLSFDAEANGLWGAPFALGAVVLDAAGAVVETFGGYIGPDGVTDPWCRENVLPAIADMPVTHADYSAMLADFAAFYLRWRKAGAAILAHMPVPVEAGVLRDMHTSGLIGDWDGPYPLIDVAGMLLARGRDPTSVDDYNRDHAVGLGAEAAGLVAHDPIYDSIAAARCYMHLREAPQ